MDPETSATESEKEGQLTPPSSNSSSATSEGGTVMFIDLTSHDKTDDVNKRVIPNFEKTRSKVYSFFTWNNTTRKWKCNHCSKSYLHHPRNTCSVMLNHITRSHPTLTKQLEEKGTETANKTRSIFEATTKKPQPIKPTKKEFRHLLASFIVATNQPFSIVEDKTLRAVLKYATMDNSELALPGAKHVRELIFEMYEEEKKALLTTLVTNQGKVSLTVDCWTSSNQFAFQGVVATWIDDQWNINNCVIDLTVLEGSHTGANICDALVSVLNDFQLWQKLHAVTTDNASNMDTMFAKLNEECVTRCVEFTSVDYRVRCLAHVMNLSCKEILKYATGSVGEEDCNPDRDDEPINSTDIVGIIRKIVVSIRSSPQRREIFKNQCKKHNMKPNMLIRDVRTRWNSTFHMLQRAYQLRIPLMSTIQSVPELHKFKLSDPDWVKIDQLIALLKPYEDATLLMSFGDSPTLANTTAVYQVLFEHLKKYTDIQVTNRLRERTRKDVGLLWLKEAADAGWRKLSDYYPSSDGLVYTVATGRIYYSSVLTS
ncbi:unnamed protein product [Orchesella dallaii]|uniref:AC transposase n=2 Tax=Orchesella dallaii TaxID=48710 RepID=A0ABP1RLF5_9HEXA